MKCFHPLAGVVSLRPNKNGNYPLIIQGSVEKLQKEGKLSPEHIRVQCGRCIGCRMNYAQEWAIRISHEVQTHEQEGKQCIFLTLTYNETFLPDNESISKKSIQLFMKRLRKKFPKQCIRYYAVGEYGEKTKRPHYHMILFNSPFQDFKLWKLTKTGYPLYTSPTLDDLWSCPKTKEQYGYANFGSVTYESAAYVARYSTKKQYGASAKEHYEHVTRYGELVNLEPEFALMSQKPRIGEKWLRKYATDIFPSDFCLRHSTKSGKKLITKVPTAYFRMLEELDPETALAVKQNRMEKISSREQLSHDRLMDMKKVFLAKTRKLERSLEA